MLRYVVLCFVLAHLHSTGSYSISSNEVIGDQELVLAYVVNRHGERTPDEDELSLSNEQDKLRNLTYIEGYEALTNVGKRRAYQIGKYLRQRYGSQGHNILSPLYFPNEIVIRCTDKDRTKMTAQVAMAALYPPEVEQQWDEGVGKVWQPVPYYSVPLSEDYLRYYSNCQKFIKLMAEGKAKAVQEEFAPYNDLIPIIFENTGRNFTEDPILFETLFDLFKSQVILGLDIPEWAKPHLPRLSEAARLAYMLYFRSEEMKKIGGGVMLYDFLKTATDIAVGKNVKRRLRLFSSHDFNIGSLMEVTKTLKSEHGIPEYGAVFSLELYRSRSRGDFTVLPVYLNQAGEAAAHHLFFKGCERDSYCDLNKFIDNTKEYVLPEREYYKLCGIKTEL